MKLPLLAMALLGGMGGDLPVIPERRSRGGFLKFPKYGSYKCECGRTISANKESCLACKQKAEA